MTAQAAERILLSHQGVERAASDLREGKLVAFPTETVYGLGADARNSDAVAQIFAAKGRPSFNPLIVHVQDLTAADLLVEFNEDAQKLAGAFWPGPLTLVLPLRDGSGLSPAVTAGLTTLGVRVPNHPAGIALLEAFGGPVAAPSANPSGRISPTTADHVLSGLGDKIAAVLDGGPVDVGLESTILGFEPEATLLREGGIPREAIEAVLGRPLAVPAPQTSDPAQPQSPGQLLSHYAPQARVRLEATTREPGELLIGFGEIEGDMTLSKSGDLTEAAKRLFGCLHSADAIGAPIAVAPIPNTGIGRAINDRLKRAAAPRD